MNEIIIERDTSLNEMVNLPIWIDFRDPKKESVKPLEFVIEGYCARGHITVIGGKAGSGKSLLNQYLLSTRDESLIPTKNGTAIYLTGADSDAITIGRRAQKFKNDGLKFQELPEDILCLAANSEFMNELAEALYHHKIDAVIFDTLADFHSGNLNEAERANITMSGFRRLARQANVAVIIVTHTTKSSNYNHKYQVEDIADSRIFTTKADFVFGLQSEYQDDRNLIELQNLKSREAKPIQPIRALIQEVNGEILISPTTALFSKEEEEYLLKAERGQREQKILELNSSGMSQRRIASHVDLSPAQVNRIIKANKD